MSLSGVPAGESPKPGADGKHVRLYCDMVADLFHHGRVRFLRKARKVLEDQGFSVNLVVGITDDQFLEAYKRKPIFECAERCEMVASCRYVDEVIPRSGHMHPINGTTSERGSRS